MLTLSVNGRSVTTVALTKLSFGGAPGTSVGVGKGGVAVYLSAQCTNEEAAAAFLLGREIGVTRYLTGGKPEGDADDFLIRADKNPNTRGVRLVADAFGVKLEEARSISEKALIAFRTEGLAEAALAPVELFIAVAQNEDAATAHADVTLPCASVYEEDGTLVNWYGRLQRTWPSISGSRGDATGVAADRSDAAAHPMQKSDAAPGWLWAERTTPSYPPVATRWPAMSCYPPAAFPWANWITFRRC